MCLAHQQPKHYRRRFLQLFPTFGLTRPIGLTANEDIANRKKYEETIKTWQRKRQADYCIIYHLFDCVVLGFVIKIRCEKLSNTCKEGYRTKFVIMHIVCASTILRVNCNPQKSDFFFSAKVYYFSVRMNIDTI